MGGCSYQTAEQLSQQSGFSLATIHRLKKAGKIPYFQPGGKGARLLFPPDAIEQAQQPYHCPNSTPAEGDIPQRLAGPQPAWMTGKNRET